MFTNCFTQHSQTILCSNVFAYLPGGPFIVNGSEGLQQTSQITSYYRVPQQVKKQMCYSCGPQQVKTDCYNSTPAALLNKSKCSCSAPQQVKVLLQHLSTSQSAPAASLNKSNCSCSISQQVKLLLQHLSTSQSAPAASLNKSKCSSSVPQ